MLKGFTTKIAVFIFLGCVLSLTGCRIQHACKVTSGNQITSVMQQSIDNNRALDAKYYPERYPERRRSRIPSGASSALMPPLSHYVKRQEVQPRFDVAANKVPAKEFFLGLVAGTEYNMVIHPNINGTISLDLKNVTIRQVMDAVHDIYGYEYHRTSYGYEVLPPQLETQLYHLNYLDIQRIGRSYTQLTTGQVSNKVGTVSVGGTTNLNIGTPGQPPVSSDQNGPPQGLGTISSIETRSEMQFWKDIEKTIQNMIPKEEGRSVTVNSQAGVIVVRAFPIELRRISNYINSLQSSLNRQVILEAKILEIRLRDEYQMGIDWAILNNPASDALNATGNNDAGIGQAANSAFPGTDLKQLNGIFAFRVNGNFKLLINLLQTQGNVQVLSSPHISTVNNQKAVIKVGQDEFFVTGVSTTNSVIGTTTLPSQDVSLTPFFSGVTLDVTPEISRDNTVILHIHPSVSEVKEQTKVIGLGTTTTGTPNNLTLPLALSTIRESDNVVRAKNGQVVVIGGLMQNNMLETTVSTPWLSNIPFLGTLFRRTAQEAVKSELVILLRPVIASNKRVINQLENNKIYFNIIKKPFHAGSLTKVFGNEAEANPDA